MSTEEQTQNNATGAWETDHLWRAGQELTIPDREVTKLAFLLGRSGTLVGDVTFTIRRESDDGIIASKVWGAFNALPTTPDWCEVTFDSPVTINELVRILSEWSGGSAGNNMDDRYQNTDVKADEFRVYCMDGGWADYLTSDQAYKYTYNGVQPAVSGGLANLVAAGVI